jgi:hypothetical protein
VLLRVIKTFIEWPLSIRELFETCRPVAERVCMLLQPFNGIGGRLFVLTHRPPLGTGLSHIPNG